MNERKEIRVSDPRVAPEPNRSERDTGIEADSEREADPLFCGLADDIWGVVEAYDAGWRMHNGTLSIGIESLRAWAAAMERASQLEAALRVIQGPADSDPWLGVYRTAGGGYEGLQAIARAALAAPRRHVRGG